ncbi:hypothetical protein QJS10_CPB11g01416 [Acorus calamus]|uniref:Uncharacterized protein n=1 Tax=Acorus calamus TaxID=4465 RepID=A0AAV9DRZ4_ACOCL|nr:hypothetical protein QJS10_CPB11g01416 [Acorus calamus]
MVPITLANGGDPSEERPPMTPHRDPCNSSSRSCENPEALARGSSGLCVIETSIVRRMAPSRARKISL